MTLLLENRHTGETLRLRRIPRDDGLHDLELVGSLPPGREGPPLHVHFAEDEEGTVTAGVLSAVVDGKRLDVGVGERAAFRRGSWHRWWNEGAEVLEFEGRATPVVDLDRYLQAVFQVVNAGQADRPSLFYIAHVLRRHRRTQLARTIPPYVQRLLFPLVVALGTVLGKYRGNDWPGAPAACPGAPVSDGETR